MRYICSHLSCSYRIASVSGSLLPRTARRQDTTDELMLSARFPIFIETGRHCTFGFENYMVLSMSVMLFCGVTKILIHELCARLQPMHLPYHPQLW